MQNTEIKLAEQDSDRTYLSSYFLQFIF